MLKNEGVVSFAINFLRRNLLLILFMVIIGNLLVYLSDRNEKPHYESAIKIHTRGIYYDHLRDLTNFLTDTSFYRNREKLGLTQDENNSLHSIISQSYRNEDLYVYELKLIFLDTNNWQGVKRKVYDYLENKTELKDIFFKRKENILSLNRQLTIAESNINFNDSSAGKEQMLKSIDLRTKRNLNAYMNDMLIREIEVLPLDHDGLHFVQKSKIKSQLRASIIFFIIALFACVVREQFRKENNN